MLLLLRSTAHILQAAAAAAAVAAPTTTALLSYDLRELKKRHGSMHRYCHEQSRVLAWSRLVSHCYNIAVCRPFTNRGRGRQTIAPHSQKSEYCWVLFVSSSRSLLQRWCSVHRKNAKVTTTVLCVIHVFLYRPHRICWCTFIKIMLCIAAIHECNGCDMKRPTV